VSTPPPGGGSRSDPPQNIATAIADISDRASALLREEVELIQAEMTEKVTRIARGAVVGVVAGIFFATALLFVLIGGAWLIYFYLPVNDFAYFWGFFVMALILVVLGVIAGLIAARFVKRGAPPVPTMAIEEARRIRDTVSGPTPDQAPVPVRVAPSTAPSAAPSTAAGPGGEA